MTQVFALEPFSTLSVLHLEQILPKQQVLSAVVHVDPHRVENHGSSLLIRTRNALKASNAPERLMQTVLDDLPNARVEGGRTRAYYLWSDHGHIHGQALEIPLALPERVRFGEPDFSALEFALQARPRTAMVLIDREWGRIFEVNLGEIRELKRLENVLDGQKFVKRSLTENLTRNDIARADRDRTDPHEDSNRRLLERNNDNDGLERNLEDQDRRFINAVAESLERTWHEQHFERLIVGGMLETIPAFRAQLSPELQAVFAGEFHSRGNAPSSQVLETAQLALDQAQESFEKELILKVREHGMRGPVETLEAVQEGRVHHLLVAFDGANIPVWRETGPNPYLFAEYPPQGQSPLSGQAVERVVLRDVLLDLRNRFGLRITMLEGDAAHKLELEMGGMAGLLRH
jgi:protein required for attachment to host cells